jgi:hypothetical protein
MIQSKTIPAPNPTDQEQHIGQQQPGKCRSKKGQPPKISRADQRAQIRQKGADNQAGTQYLKGVFE